MQSGKGKSNKWLLEFNKSKTENDHLMNWVSSNAKKNNIDFEVIEPKKNKLIIKSYADNFLS